MINSFLAVLDPRYRTRASYCGGFSSCGARVLGVCAQWLWHVGLVAPQHVGSSRTSDQACVACAGRHVITHLEPDILECEVKWAFRKHHYEQN